MFVKSIQQVSLNRLFRSMLAASATGIAFVPAASAQFYVPAPEMLPMSSFINTTYLNNTSLIEQALPSPSSSDILDTTVPPLVVQSLIVRPVGSSRIPARLSMSYPTTMRSEAETLFSQLLERYAELERQLDIPQYDLAGAMAALVAGSYMAYNDVQLPDAHFGVLVQQMRSAITTSPEFVNVSDADKQDIYDQMAILGTFMATTQIAQSQNPDSQVAANMKAAAASYLQQLLDVSPDQIVINAQGLSVIQ